MFAKIVQEIKIFLNISWSMTKTATKTPEGGNKYLSGVNAGGK